MYIARNTRSYILYLVGKLTGGNRNPHKEYLKTAKQILNYLYNTKNKKIQFHKTGNPLECNVDANIQGT